MRLLVFQHIAIEHPGVFREFLKQDGIRWDAVELDEGQPIPDLRAYDALWVMGGPMDVWDVEDNPWLIPEKRAIRQWVRELKRPFLGVCLGHQLLALAAGARTRRLAVGHHGGNHAVLDLESSRVDIGAHNHEIEVLDDDALGAAGYRVSHRDLNDATVEGLTHAGGRVASVQFHPEGAPGPIDAARVFDLAVGRATA
jgi:carbamoylphosphate synthase small subunit